VILINLLPHRQEKRQRRKVAFFVGIGVAAFAGVVVFGVWYLVLQQLTAAQQRRNEFLTAEIAKLDAQIKDIADLKAQIEGLRARQKAVEDLQTDRNVPVHVLSELVKQTPEGVYLTSIKQTDKIISISGVAQTNERVSEMLRNTANASPWLEKPELVEIRVSGVQSAARDQRKLFDFNMRLSVKPPVDAASAAKAALPAPAVTVAAASAAATVPASAASAR